LRTKEFPFLLQMGRKAGETGRSGHLAPNPPNKGGGQAGDPAGDPAGRAGGSSEGSTTDHTLLLTRSRNQESLIPIFRRFQQAHSINVPSFPSVADSRRMSPWPAASPAAAAEDLLRAKRLLWSQELLPRGGADFLDIKLIPLYIRLTRWSNYRFTRYVPHDPASCQLNW